LAESRPLLAHYRALLAEYRTRLPHEQAHTAGRRSASTEPHNIGLFWQNLGLFWQNLGLFYCLDATGTPTPKHIHPPPPCPDVQVKQASSTIVSDFYMQGPRAAFSMTTKHLGQNRSTTPNGGAQSSNMRVIGSLVYFFPFEDQLYSP